MPRDPDEFLKGLAGLSDESRERDETAAARSAVVRWLGLSRKPSGQARDFLQRQGFDSVIIDRVLSELKEEGRLDDFRLARQKSRTRTGAKSESALRTTQRLSAQGLDREAIEQALAERPTDRDLALAALQGKFRPPLAQEPGITDLKVKYYRFLMNRGFSPDIVRESIHDFLKGSTENDDFAD